MKCPICVKEGLKSRVYVGGTQATLANSLPGRNNGGGPSLGIGTGTGGT